MNSGRASGSKSRISEFLQKGMTKQQWIVILLLGLLLSVIALPVSKGNSDTAGEKLLTAPQTIQEQKSELELFGEFYELLNNEPMKEEQTEFMERLIQNLKEVQA